MRSFSFLALFRERRKRRILEKESCLLLALAFGKELGLLFHSNVGLFKFNLRCSAVIMRVSLPRLICLFRFVYGKIFHQLARLSLLKKIRSKSGRCYVTDNSQNWKSWIERLFLLVCTFFSIRKQRLRIFYFIQPLTISKFLINELAKQGKHLFPKKKKKRNSFMICPDTCKWKSWLDDDSGSCCFDSWRLMLTIIACWPPALSKIFSFKFKSCIYLRVIIIFKLTNVSNKRCES